MDIAQVDSNLRVTSTLNRTDVEWHSAAQAPVRIYGAATCEPYRRMPYEVAAAVSEGVRWLSEHTAGIRARFRTDSPYIAIHAEWAARGRMPHMPDTGICGFDLYMVKDGQHFFVNPPFTPPVDSDYGYESVVDTVGGMQEYVLNFPLYNGVTKLYIGIQEGSKLEAPTPYTYEKPIVFYGSSITQGGCASRPGTCYTAHLSRRLDADVVNLGFSGSARGEEAMREYLAELPMAVFVSDYDHNAPDAAHLQATHYALYEAVRSRQPDLPYVMVSKPDFHTVHRYWYEQNVLRRQVILDSYHRAVAQGDKNVYFVDGGMFFAGPGGQDCTVDGCHPNDLGFYRMADAMEPLLRTILANIR